MRMNNTRMNKFISIIEVLKSTFRTMTCAEVSDFNEHRTSTGS